MFAVRIAILGVALALTSLAGAQTTYRWIDKTTGKTVFSDQPPPPGAKSVSIREGKEPGNERQMNFATRQAAEKYPVTLFTTVNCTEVCANARAFLNGRGIPFTERLLKSEQEIAETTATRGKRHGIVDLLRTLRQPAKAEQQQDRRDDLHDKLRDREIRR